MSDPLSLLAGEDSSSSEDEVDQERTPLKTESTELTSSSTDKLPSPSTLFATIGRPSFLTDPQERQIDWDNFAKNELDNDKYSIHITEDGGYAAIPPSEGDNRPVYNSLSAAIVGTYNKEAAGTVSSAPVRYTEAQQVAPKYQTVLDSGYTEVAVSKTGGKRPLVVENEKHQCKKIKPETFRQKEKRKRDMGQSSRGKSYVEEEKRLLRQQFGTDEVMS